MSSQYRPPFANMRLIKKTVSGHVPVPGNVTTDPFEQGDPVAVISTSEETLRAQGKDHDGKPLKAQEIASNAASQQHEGESEDLKGRSKPPHAEIPSEEKARRINFGFDPEPEPEVLEDLEEVEPELPEPEPEIPVPASEPELEVPELEVPESKPSWDKTMRKADLIEIALAAGLEVSEESHTKAMIIALLNDNNVQ